MKPHINEMIYTDYIGFINQWNVPPGGYMTLNKWRVYSMLNSKSNILEFACTTGFSVRELCKMAQCKGLGIDISKASIQAARHNAKQYAKSVNLKYVATNALEFSTKDRFSHVVIGAALRFFPNPTQTIQKCISLMQNDGFLLSAEFFVEKSIPDKVLAKAQKVFGITPTNVGYKEVMSVYKGLELMYEDFQNIIPETEDELAHYVDSTVERIVNDKNIKDDSLIKKLKNRLNEIKQVANELRPYQRYVILVHRYRKTIYPHRYVELF